MINIDYPMQNVLQKTIQSKTVCYNILVQARYDSGISFLGYKPAQIFSHMKNSYLPLPLYDGRENIVFIC